jgi:hypothetical protein
MVDEIDSDLLAFKWHSHAGKKTHYAGRDIRLSDGKKYKELLHRVISGRVGHVGAIDHKNGHGLDCRRENLRPATTAQNAFNRRKDAGTLSRFKGVTFNKDRQKWQAQIKFNYRNKYLGLHADECDAARAYDSAAAELFGEFAVLNFPAVQQ